MGGLRKGVGTGKKEKNVRRKEKNFIGPEEGGGGLLSFATDFEKDLRCF